MQTNPTMPAPALQQARSQLLLDGELPPGCIDERLARSWRRSLAAGLSPGGNAPAGDTLSAAQLQGTLDLNHELVSYSRPVMEYLFEQVRHSHGMVILADRHGVLMHTLGEADFLSRADRVALRPGASWNERQRGTNAIGTALVEAGPVEIHGPEHYLERNGFLTCAAATIVSARGELLGVLDISGEQHSRHPHTLGLVNTAARMIENQLLLATCRRHLRLHLHAQAEGIGTLAEGLVALSEDGWIVGANRQGLALLGLSSGEIGATPLARVLDLRLDQLLARAGQSGQAPLLVHRRDGLPLHARMHAEPSLPAASRRVAPPAPADALAKLDTGDARWRAATEKARRIVGKPIPLLLHGESGVGKELFARAVHESSPRASGPFVAINCAALPENLIEAELFGYRPGAFTGARKEGSIGRLREAEGGTLFLDEIGDMPLPLQTRLLRVLQERQVSPLGGGQPVKVDFALICATHNDLRAASASGHFRSDLYYRINGLTLNLPALRERNDFAALTDRLLSDLSEGAGVQVEPELLARLAACRWPGNLRQYASVLRTAVAMLNPGETRIDVSHLPDDLLEELYASASPLPREPAPLSNLQDISMAAIRQALAATQGNVSAAAKQLGISRQTLYRKMKGAG